MSISVDIPSTSGVYQIINLIDNKRYVGSSYDIHKERLSNLENKKKHSDAIKLSWIKRKEKKQQ